MLDKIEVLEKPMEINDEMRIRLEPNIISGNDVLTVRRLGKAFHQNRLFENVNFEIKRGERVAIIGGNGTGKTTILKMLNGILEPDEGEISLGSKVHIGYYDQEHQVLNMDKNLFDELQDTYPSMNNTQIRNILAAFFIYRRRCIQAGKRLKRRRTWPGIPGKADAFRSQLPHTG